MPEPPAVGEVRKVQRVLDQIPMPTLHLEAEVPAADEGDEWCVRVSGLVERPRALTLGELKARPAVDIEWDFHCVWGWSRRAVRWQGVPLADLLEVAGISGGASHVVAAAVEGPYASCLDLATARRSLLAWAMDGEPLEPDHGAPLRLVPPPDRWAYKGIKWLGSVEVLDHPRYGMWESLVGNPVGEIPPELQELD
jgi:DMSO/TMAO reductase YedYZ molybdopterin-dependent catalytic subunit